MKKYQITTRVVSGKIRSKLSENGIPAKVSSLIPKYQQIYKLITEVQIKAINEGSLEKITTTFEI